MTLKDVALLSKIAYTRSRNERMTETGFILYPNKPDLEPFKTILGLDKLVEQRYLLEYDLTTLCNMLHQSMLYDKKKLEECSDITEGIETLVGIGNELDRCIYKILIRHYEEVT